MRLVELPGGMKIILSDTVGFISDLPTQLVAAFRATLEEVSEADVIVHVRDTSDPDSDAQRRDVQDVLKELGVDEHDPRPVVEVLNKADLLDEASRLRRVNGLKRAGRNDHDPAARALLVSARTGEGIDAFVSCLTGVFNRLRQVVEFELSPEDGASLAWLYRHGEVLARKTQDNGRLNLTLRMTPPDIGRFSKQFKTWPVAAN